MNCDQIIERLDLHIDGTPENPEVARHIETCQACSRILANRIALRDRLRTAVRRTEIPLGLQPGIHRSIASERRSIPLRWPSLALAAAILLAVGTTRWYQAGHLRLTPGSQEAYIESIAPRVSPIMQVGLTQHVHCAVFRSYPAQPPSIAELIKEFSPQYSALIPAMQQHVPPEFRVVMAHLCTRQGRDYIHVIARRGSGLISLLITKKEAGDRMGAGLDTSSVQRFNIAAFETNGYLVYLVSDMGQDQNQAILQAMAPQIQTVMQGPVGQVVNLWPIGW
jgi:anti-sigma factor RsiW